MKSRWNASSWCSSRLLEPSRHVHERAAVVVCGLPDLSLQSAAHLRLLVDSPGKPTAVLVVDEIGGDVAPLGEESVVIAQGVVRIHVAEDQQSVEPLRLRPPVL